MIKILRSVLGWVLLRLLGIEAEKLADNKVDINERLRICQDRLDFFASQRHKTFLLLVRQDFYGRVYDDLQEEFYAKRKKEWLEKTRIPTPSND